MNILFIDTSSNQEVSVGLQIEKKRYFLKDRVGRQKAQEVLPMIDRLLNEHNLLLKDIKEINAVSGPGSFTGLRVGISIANTLGFLLSIPVNGMPVGKYITPVYS